MWLLLWFGRDNDAQLPFPDNTPKVLRKVMSMDDDAASSHKSTHEGSIHSLEVHVETLRRELEALTTERNHLRNRVNTLTVEVGPC